MTRAEHQLPTTSSPRAEALPQVRARGFFEGDTVHVAQSLLGMVLTTEIDAECTSGIIVEVEAYLGSEDPASHAYRGETARNAAMFGHGGLGYVYLSYGIHHCFNVVTGPAGQGSAVLIRALQPLEGIDVMSRRRGTTDIRALTSGPGRLCQALGVHLGHNRIDLATDIAVDRRIYLSGPVLTEAQQIATSPRIGITKGAELPLRFFLPTNPYVSRTVSQRGKKPLC